MTPYIRHVAAALVVLWVGTACTVEEGKNPGGKGGETSDAGTNPDASTGGDQGTGGTESTGGATGAGGAGATNAGGSTGTTPDGGEDAGIVVGGPCNGLTANGRCDGATVVFCEDAKTAVVDCSKIGSTCAVTNGRADCSNTDRSPSCGNLTALGTCNGARLDYCDSSGIAAMPREIDCAAYGQKCDPHGATDNGAICVPQGPCPTGVDENGVCNSNSLSFCEDTGRGPELYTFDCGVDQCMMEGSFSDCFVTGAADGCNGETAAGRCDGTTRVSCLGNVVAREDCPTLGLECRAATGGGSRCQTPSSCPQGGCPDGTVCTSGICTGSTTATKDWTFMVYMIANNNLSQAAWSDLNEMETVGTTAKINVVAEVRFDPDYSQTIDQQYLGGDVYRMEVDKDSDTSEVTSLQNSMDGGAFSMSDPGRVTEFIQYAASTYPAKHYALVMWNHGAGYMEAFVDGSAVLSLKDVVSGIRDSNVHLDLLGFDACLMSMHEVAYATRGVANYLVASEEVEPGAGYPYDTVLSGLAAKTTMDAPTFGAWIVDKYAESYTGGYRPESTTSALIDLSKIESTNEELSSVAESLRSDAVGNRATIRSSLDADSVLRFTQKQDADLSSVMSTLSGLQLTNSQKPTSDMVTYIAGKNVVVHSQYTGDLGAAKGLAVFLPQSSSGDYYGSDALEGYKSRVSFLPMQPWISFVSSLTDDSAPPPTPGTGAVSTFSVVLDWASTIDGKTSNVDLDLYVFEPDGEYATPSNGTVSGSGLLSGDSYDTGVPEESYQLASTHEVGTYVVLAHYYGGPAGEVAYPTLQVFRPDLPGGSRTLIRAKAMDRDLVQVPMDNSNPLNDKIDSSNFQNVLDLEYSNLWYITTIEVK
ncbi:MAG TPA: clostripain-related cysteine peptidase [Polyangiaceae bacterium]|nr:clostripain-related cysteine peptidase [Polyangiaceae bacterium]